MNIVEEWKSRCGKGAWWSLVMKNYSGSWISFIHPEKLAVHYRFSPSYKVHIRYIPPKRQKWCLPSGLQDVIWHEVAIANFPLQQIFKYAQSHANLAPVRHTATWCSSQPGFSDVFCIRRSILIYKKPRIAHRGYQFAGWHLDQPLDMLVSLPGSTPVHGSLEPCRIHFYDKLNLFLFLCCYLKVYTNAIAFSHWCDVTTSHLSRSHLPISSQPIRKHSCTPPHRDSRFKNNDDCGGFAVTQSQL